MIAKILRPKPVPILGIVALITLCGNISRPALADPPPEPTFPSVFCFRITDIREDKTDPQLDKFTFEFEVLNWTNQEATDVDIALNVGTSQGLVFSGAGVDPNGAPFGPGSSWAPRLLPDGRPPGNQDILNDWSVTTQTQTYIRWDAGTAISNFTLTAGGPVPPWLTPDPESIDDGFNVRDGFTFTVDDFDPGDILSFNWFLTNNGNPIGTALGGNPFGFGVLNLARVDGVNFPNPLFFNVNNPTQRNTGFNQTQVQFYDSVYIVPDPATFALEFGGGLTAQFLNNGDSQAICGQGGCSVNAEKIPEPFTILGTATAISFGVFFKKHRKKHKD